MYKNLQMSQGVYFVTKGIAEAYARANDGSGGVEEEKVKGIVSAGKLFGYSRFLAAFLEEDMAVKAFTTLYVSCNMPRSWISQTPRRHGFSPRKYMRDSCEIWGNVVAAHIFFFPGSIRPHRCSSFHDDDNRQL